MYEYLNDQKFLSMLDDSPIKTQYVKIIILNFQEQPIREIQGITQDGGTVNVNGSSSLRRTTSFTMFADATTNDLTNINNLISLNKKIKLLIGYKNTIKGYEHYGDIIWFKGGTYVIMQASISNSTSGSTISVQGRDKMVFLNGQAGGIIPSFLELQQRYEKLEDGSIVISYPTIYQIIQEVVSEYGGESISNIIISDISLKTKQLIKYIGNAYFHISKKSNYFQENSYTNAEYSERTNEEWNTYTYGQDIGYQETDFTYPGKLTVEPGSTVTTILDKICQILGNFEYFYDLDGKFIFQEKKNYLNNAYTPIHKIQGQNYIKNFSNSKYYYSFNDMKQVISISANPKYENIKNDFIVWGKNNTGAAILYHLAIDSKPQLSLADKYMWAMYYNNNYFVRYVYNENNSLPEITKKDIEDYYKYKLSDIYKTYLENELTPTERAEIGENSIYLFFFQLAYSTLQDKEEEILLTLEQRLKEKENEDFDTYSSEKKELLEEYENIDMDNYNSSNFNYVLIGKPCVDWREELYRQALGRAAAGLPAEYYDNELITFWRTLYDPMKQVAIIENDEKIIKYWYNEETKEAWNPDVFNNPGALIYWIDFLDDGDQIRQYSIPAIGKRTKVQKSDDIKNIFNPEVKDLLFIENNFSTSEERANKINDLQKKGQAYSLYKPSQNSIFGISSTGMSAFDTIRNMLYQHFTYNTQINITCLPKYYLEPNNLIYIADTNNGVSGDYIINQFTLPLSYKGTMTITASEALTKI